MTALAPTPIEEFQVGDRLSFIVESGADDTGRTVYGTVEAVGDGPVGYRIHVLRDDERQGGGISGSWVVAEGRNDPLVRLTPAQETPPPGETDITRMRAVFCACCSRPTGEFVVIGDTPQHTYCDGCRNLPSHWIPRTTRTTGEIQNQEHGVRQYTHYDIGRAQRHTDRGPMPPIYDEEPEEDAELDPITCIDCGSAEFALTFIATYEVISSSEPGTTMLFFPEPYRPNVDWEHNDAAPICSQCGREQHHINWELA